MATNIPNGLELAGVAVTSTAAELNALDGITSSVGELNILTGVTATATELNLIDGYTGTTANLNTLTDASSAAGIHTHPTADLSDVTSTATELNLLDGSEATNATASVAAIWDASKRFVSSANPGTAGTCVTAVELGDGINHTTILTLTGIAFTFTASNPISDGALIYTFPAGTVIINSATMSVGVTMTSGTPTTDQPEVGLGTVIGTGAQATLGAVDAAAENIIGPLVADDLAGTAEVGSTANSLVIETTGGLAHLVHLNYADTFANLTNNDATAAGTVVLNWTLIPLS